MRKLSTITMVIVMLCSFVACQDSLEPTPVVKASGIAPPPPGGGGGTPPYEADPTCVANGTATGISDALNLFSVTYYSAPCNLGPDQGGTGGNQITGGSGIQYTYNGQCFNTTPTSQAAYWDFVIGYRANTQAIIDANENGCFRDFRVAMLAAFNAKLMEFSINYGIPYPS